MEKPPEKLQSSNSFHDAKEKVSKVANGAVTLNGAATGAGMQTPPRHSVESPRAAEAANAGAAVLRQAPRKPAVASAPTVNKVEYFGQGMLRKTTTASSEASPRPSEDPRDSSDTSPSGTSSVGDTGGTSGDTPTSVDYSKPVGSRPAMFKGPSIPAAREADISPAILKHVERVPVRLP